MGQKVNPHGIRLGIVKDWDAKWYADKDFADNLHEDIKIRKYLKDSLGAAGVSKIETERSKNRLKLTIHTAKPGMVIGRGGSGIEQIKEGLKGKTEKAVDINISEIRQPLEAFLDLLDAGAAASDDHARLCRMDRELQAVLAALRLHAGNTCGLEALLEVIANLDVLM